MGWTKMEHTRNFFFDKVQKAHLINKMKLEEHNILDGRTWYHFKYDNTAPKTAFLFTFLPYNMDRAWTYEGGREHTPNGGFAMTHKITHGENVIQEGEMVFDVKANDGSKFEMEHLHKMTMTEESPFYGMVFWYTGRYGKTVERKMTFVSDKINKSFLFVPKMSMNTVMTIDGEKTSEFVFDNTQAKKPFLDIAVESDRKTKLHVLFNFEEDNKWELKVDRVPGQKMTIEAVIDGQKWTGEGTLDQGDMKLNLKVDSEFTGKHYTLDFDLNPAGMWGLHVTGDVDGPVDAKWTMQKDFTMGEIVVKYKNQNYAFMQLKGNAEMRGLFPVAFDYVVKYNINDAMQHQGKAKMKFDGKTPAKKFEMSFAPKTGTPIDYMFNMDFSSGFKYDYDLKINALTVEKGEGEWKWVNNAQKFELITKDTFTVHKQSPFHWMNVMVTRGREWTKMEHSRNIFFDKVNKAHLINKMKLEEHNILDGRTCTTSSTTTPPPRLPSSSLSF